MGARLVAHSNLDDCPCLQPRGESRRGSKLVGVQHPKHWLPRGPRWAGTGAWIVVVRRTGETIQPC